MQFTNKRIFIIIFFSVAGFTGFNLVRYYKDRGKTPPTFALLSPSKRAPLIFPVFERPKLAGLVASIDVQEPKEAFLPSVILHAPLGFSALLTDKNLLQKPIQVILGSPGFSELSLLDDVPYQKDLVIPWTVSVPGRFTQKTAAIMPKLFKASPVITPDHTLVQVGEGTPFSPQALSTLPPSSSHARVYVNMAHKKALRHLLTSRFEGQSVDTAMKWTKGWQDLWFTIEQEKDHFSLEAFIQKNELLTLFGSNMLGVPIAVFHPQPAPNLAQFLPILPFRLQFNTSVRELLSIGAAFLPGSMSTSEQRKQALAAEHHDVFIAFAGSPAQENGPFATIIHIPDAKRADRAVIEQELPRKFLASEQETCAAEKMPAALYGWPVKRITCRGELKNITSTQDYVFLGDETLVIANSRQQLESIVTNVMQQKAVSQLESVKRFPAHAALYMDIDANTFLLPPGANTAVPKMSYAALYREGQKISIKAQLPNPLFRSPSESKPLQPNSTKTRNH